MGARHYGPLSNPNYSLSLYIRKHNNIKSSVDVVFILFYYFIRKKYNYYQHFRDGSTGLLIVDNGPAITRQSVQIRPPDKPFAPSEAEGLFIGGMPHRLISPVTGYRAGIRGCIADLVINTDYHLGVINRSAMRHNIGECEV